VTPPVQLQPPAIERIPFGRRDRTDISATVLRVVGKESKTAPLDVAAFQSFAD